MRVRVINGPNLNLLGQRESQIYGVESLAAVEERMRDLAAELGVEVDFVQSNSEGALVDAIQECRGQRDAIIINPGGYTHTSVAIHDAIRAAEVPAIEVHVSNIHAREGFRATTITGAACVGIISGMGVLGYPLALRAAVELAGREG
ncbi:MAG: type II 3-dehydroquinate dehydratase [Acidobacteriota bacterium]|jgi:3-dehydroquinate dehydratase-2|nr:type II 3-dehydroquinate dehydratase [Acidobacteriota bacterium]